MIESTLRREIWLDHSIDDVFEFFADATNLEMLTPRWLHFRIVTPLTIKLESGTLIDYRLRLRGIPIRWRSQITTWRPPHRFVDQQVKGPYRLWIHDHRFEARDGGTLVRDKVRYRVPGGYLVDRFLVAPDLDRIFDYRMERLRERFQGKRQTTVRNGALRMLASF